MKIDKSRIRNFSIIAHIDHGKSTLADRLLESTNTVAKRDMKAQLLDQLDLERERGITIKLNAVQINYVHTDGIEYLFHLIDTPGHVDFAYEVSRSLAACDGALLVVDAAQGVQPQTIANTYLALENNVFIAPVINKIDLPAADVEKTKKQIEEILGITTDRAPLISAKTGLNIDQVFKTIIEEIPAPEEADESKPLQALIFDSYYDTYRGAILYVALKNGTIRVGDKVKFMSNGSEHTIMELGIRTPVEVKKDELVAGEVGWIAAGVKSIKDVNIGDTVTNAYDGAKEALPGYRQLNPMVFCGFYPVDTGEYLALGEAIDKIMLEDSALQYEKETSQALGFGFRLGFLGLLHLEIVQQRLEREWGMSIIATAPSVKYNVYLTNKTMQIVENPSRMPDRGVIDYIEEPIVKATIIVPNDYVGPIMTLCHDKRGVYQSAQVIDSRTQALIFLIPLGEIVFDFFNEMKSVSKGYASFDYEYNGYERADLVKMSFLLNGEEVDALSVIIDRRKAYDKGKDITERLKAVIPRQNFEIPIQAAIGGKVIARETIKAVRKNVTAKCSGGDINRKRKLLNKQKEGKKKMKSIGSVELPQEAFVSILDVKAEKQVVSAPKKQKQHRSGH